ncbi:MAG: ribonuclease HII [Pseudobutyrivibrio sp.]|nr:ribonuclease HII [Pseudobutyrivibrio sp.]
MEKKISEIQKEYKDTRENLLPDFIQEYIKDGRPGVSKIVSQAQKRMEKIRVERERTEALKEFEKKYWQSLDYVGGIDEVGRGPLAGPVVTACVVFPKDVDILYINDSKKLTAAKREELYQEIMEKALSVSIGMASEARIDEINILQADYEAMRQAISLSKVPIQLLLNDAVTIPDVDIKQVAIIKGDAKSISIGAASIIAKVTRDRMMVEYDKMYPEYNFASNKGYGSKEHIEALKKYGPCPIHRRSFIGNFV